MTQMTTMHTAEAIPSTVLTIRNAVGVCESATPKEKKEQQIREKKS